jgi:integrase
VLARLLAPPFTLGGADAQQRRRRGLIGVVDWLAEQPGSTWQQRWQASGAEALGNADWWRPWLQRLQSGSQRRGQSVSITSNLRVCLLVLVCAEVIRPSLGWLLNPRAPQGLTAELARTRDPDGFAELTALCEVSPAGRTMTMAAVRRVATIVAAKGGTMHDITVGDCLELSLLLDGDTRRKNKGLGFYQLLHQMGVFGPQAPSTLRAFATQGQLSPAQMLEPYAIECAPVRDLLLIEEHRHRADSRAQLTLVRAFYLDLAQWAMEEPARWGPWAAPCPVRREDLTRTKELRRRKSRMDQRTRERLPVLPALLTRVQNERLASSARLAAAKATVPGGSFTDDGRLQRRVISGASTARVWVEDPDTAARVDLSGLEDRAFWTWAAVETLRHTGIRIEELTELSHHSLIQYTLPTSRELIPLLQIAPSKTDTERLLVISPELADVLAAVIHRVRTPNGAVPCVTSYDTHERRWNPPLPLLFQRRFGMGTRSIPAGTLRDWICRALDGSGITDVTGRPLRFTPHDFRRLFITDAVLHGMPPHIAQLVAGHRDINTTMGYKNPRELHQMGEFSQVACRGGDPSRRVGAVAYAA